MTLGGTMKKMMIGAALLAGLATAPAQAAGEARVELRGGIAWAEGTEEAFVGGAAGYDFDLGDRGFLGVEGSADKVLAGGSDVVWGVGARGGVKTGDKGRVYATGGLQFCCGESDFYAGAGYQYRFHESAYLKVEYRRTFGFVDVNLVGIGIGANF